MAETTAEVTTIPETQSAEADLTTVPKTQMSPGVTNTTGLTEEGNVAKPATLVSTDVLFLLNESMPNSTVSCDPAFSVLLDSRLDSTEDDLTTIPETQMDYCTEVSRSFGDTGAPVFDTNILQSLPRAGTPTKQNDVLNLTSSLARLSISKVSEADDGLGEWCRNLDDSINLDIPITSTQVSKVLDFSDKSQPTRRSSRLAHSQKSNNTSSKISNNKPKPKITCKTKTKSISNKSVSKPKTNCTISSSRYVCTEKCMKNNQWNGNDTMLKCCICLMWAHPICLGDDESDKWLTEGPFTCDNCRQLSHQTRTILTTVTANQNMLKQQQQQITDMYTLILKQQEQIQALQCHLPSVESTCVNATHSTQTHMSTKSQGCQTTEQFDNTQMLAMDLEMSLDETKEESRESSGDDDGNRNSSGEDHGIDMDGSDGDCDGGSAGQVMYSSGEDNGNVDNEDTLPSLLIGNSLLRLVDETQTDVNNIIATGGGKLCDITDQLQHLGTDFKTINIIIGTNEALNRNVSSTTIDNNIDKMLTAARKYSKDVKVASIPPTNCQTTNMRIDAINNSLMDYCIELNCAYVDLNTRFHPAQMLSSDGIHLNKEGTSHLLDAMDITFRNVANKPYERIPNQKYARKNAPQSYAHVAQVKNNSKEYFRGPKHPLSNLYNCKLGVDGHYFHSSEAAYQFNKVMFLANSTHCKRNKSIYWNLAKQIKQTTNPWTAMKLGKVPTNDNWKRIKIDTMKAILTEKYAQCTKYRTYLQQTGTKEIIEDTSNEFWGRGHTGNGLNILGNLHQCIRVTLKNNTPSPFQQRIPCGNY